MCSDHTEEDKKPIKNIKPIGDDNPNDGAEIQDETAPNSSLEADKIIEANNFLGDL